MAKRIRYRLLLPVMAEPSYDLQYHLLHPKEYAPAEPPRPEAARALDALASDYNEAELRCRLVARLINAGTLQLEQPSTTVGPLSLCDKEDIILAAPWTCGLAELAEFVASGTLEIIKRARRKKGTS